jgi:hypothetical protein
VLVFVLGTLAHCSLAGLAALTLGMPVRGARIPPWPRPHRRLPVPLPGTPISRGGAGGGAIGESATNRAPVRPLGGCSSGRNM